ncbi:hypothetical protein HN51_018579 [Arachis hypogaea]|uniref:Protein ECERIFERUM n=1 Tax=Arachis hypogaea TaxID=3818 RepID=A0A445BU47_ARAHY|nr:protein ECERIFERUM 2 [Arachis hypogaea]QHO30178.1 Protein ECERIFERUM [Arachis hypogaea]RYR42111.1 hypothetical protein Ahy_A08g038566 [Arachis hypogaea]
MGSLGNLEAPPLLTSRISTVVPATPRGDQNSAYQLSYMDLLMKLHYIRPVFFFASESVQGLTISDLKTPMFPLLDTCSHVSGRIRRSESGRPFVKCNDAGVRIAESHRDVTLREWFDENNGCLREVDDGLVHDHVLGPDLGFSPLVFVKFTWFKCGGLSVGLSWAHVLGDAFSALDFITKWSNILAGHVPVPPKSLQIPNNLTAPDEEIIIQPNNNSLLVSENPTSIKRATIVGEYWLASNVSHVATHSFHITSKQLHHLVKATSNNNNVLMNKYFEIISALIWKCVTHIRGNVGPKAVTICTKSCNGSKRGENDIPTNNGLVLSKIEPYLASGKSDISELARIIAEKKMVENHIVKNLVEKDEGKEDFFVYGANLTFVDLEEADLFGVKLNGHKPIVANCSFRGVGDQGVVLVFPSPSKEDSEDGGNNGRIVTVSLPVKELYQLKNKLGAEWGIV